MDKAQDPILTPKIPTPPVVWVIAGNDSGGGAGLNHGVADEVVERDELERAHVRRREDHRRRETGLERDRKSVV